MAGVWFPSGHSIQTGSGAYLAFHPVGIGGSSSGVKHPGHEINHPHPSSAEIKNGGAIPPFPHVFMAWCVIN
jgi:hypothetical protein